MTKRAKVPVSKRALLQRINRKLESNGEKIYAYRGADQPEVGDHFRVSSRSGVVEVKIDLAKMGKKLGVLKSFEELQ